jgi:hypothetical protein
MLDETPQQSRLPARLGSILKGFSLFPSGGWDGLLRKSRCYLLLGVVVGDGVAAAVPCSFFSLTYTYKSSTARLAENKEEHKPDR